MLGEMILGSGPRKRTDDSRLRDQRALCKAARYRVKNVPDPAIARLLCEHGKRQSGALGRSAPRAGDFGLGGRPRLFFVRG